MNSLVLMVQGILLFSIVRLYFKPNFSRALTMLLVAYVLMWHIAPVLLTILFLDGGTGLNIVGYTTFLEYALLDSITMQAAILPLFFYRKVYFEWIVRHPISYVQIPSTLIVWVLTLGTFLTYAMSTWIWPIAGGTYAEQNSFNVNFAGTDQFNMSGTLAFIRFALIYLSYTCFIIKWPKDSKKLYIFISASFCICTNILSEVISGGRISLLVPFLVAIIFVVSQDIPLRKSGWILVGVASLTLTLGATLVYVVSEYRSTTSLSLNDLWVETLSATRKDGGERDIKLMAKEIAVKFDSFSTGAYLVEEIGRGKAGWQPYKGAFLAIVPRWMLTSKPVPGSDDGTYLGHPSRLVAGAIGMDTTGGNVGVSPSAVAIWHFGYLGMLVLALCNIASLYFINSLFQSGSIIFKTLGMSLVGIPALATIYCSPDVIVMNIERIVVIILSLAVVYKLNQTIKRPG